MIYYIIGLIFAVVITYFITKKTIKPEIKWYTKVIGAEDIDRALKLIDIIADSNAKDKSRYLRFGINKSTKEISCSLGYFYTGSQDAGIALYMLINELEDKVKAKQSEINKVLSK